ncbi:hypothetical protein BDV18DRAFT_162646 [Aspergillus unguis]
MTTAQKRHQPPIPEPEYNNLEVRCTWSGEYEEVSDVRITLDVKCTPNTQLQLLSLRGPGIFFEESFLEPLSDNEDGSDTREADTPRSPLFGFSPLGHRDSLDDYEDVDCSDASVPVEFRELSSPVRSPRPVLAQRDGTCENTPCAFNFPVDGPAMGRPVESIPSTPTPSSSPDANFEGVRPRKRSASDAEFPDSGSDIDDEHDRILKDVTHRKARQLNSIESADQGSISHIASPGGIALPRSPKKSTPTKIPALTAPNENAKPTSTNRSTDTKGPKPFEETPQKPSLIPRSTSTSPSKTGPSKKSPLKSPVTASFAETAVGYHLANITASENKSKMSDKPRTSPVKEPRVRFQLPDDASNVDNPRNRSLSPSPSRSKGVQSNSGRVVIDSNSPRNGSLLESGDSRESCFGESSRHSKRNNVHQPDPFDEPRVEIIDGLVVLKNTERIRPATYKVSITAVMFIMYPSTSGWSDLELPGLPKTGGGKIGIILFLMPADHGLEIRTTSLNRASIVENCLVAEFANSGNLVIPLRRCERESCGEISDFTVDQEIVCLNKVKPGNCDDGGDFDIEMDCHAVCFIRLYNRLFWSERCIIPLFVDGGPEGVFHCNVTSRAEQTKKIVIQAKDGTKMGVSRVHVTCSPKDMCRLYVRWSMKFSGSKAAYWLPRIYSAYSTSHELSKHNLRQALLEVLNDPSYKCAGAEATQIETGNASKPTQRFDESVSDLSDDPEDIPLESSEAFPTLSRIGQVVNHVMRFGEDAGHILKPVLIGLLWLVFLRVGFSIASRIGHSSLFQTPVQKSEQTSQLPPFQTWNKLLGNSQSDDQSNLNILELIDEYDAIEVVEEEIELRVEEADDMHARTTVTFRDRIDYWLGWTGPV